MERLVFIFQVILLLSTLQMGFTNNRDNSYCELRYVLENRKFLNVLWVNMEESSYRRKFMIKTLTDFGFRHQRVNAVTPDNLIVPRGFIFATDCQALTDHARRGLANRIQRDLQPNATRPVVFLASHCGQSKNNFRFNSLANTASHLLAIYRAVFETEEDGFHSDYALIMEDDLRFAYEINFPALVATAPKDFSILQLVTNNPQGVRALWEDQYLAKRNLWIKRKEFDPFWSTGAFLIQKKQFIGLIDKLVTRHSPHLYSFRIEAYDRSICKVLPHPEKKIVFIRPYCCNRTTLMLQPPCILSPHGYEADSFIYNMALGSTYVLTAPIVLPFTETAFRSTQHQDQVTRQEQGFAVARTYLSNIYPNPQDHPLISPLLNLNCSR